MTSMTLPWPPSVNTYWRHPLTGRFAGMHLISEKGRAYRKNIQQLCMVARIKPKEGRLKVTILASPPDRRARDLDNVLKGLLDALTHGGAWHDDEQIDDLHIIRRPVKAGGEIQIEIGEISQ